MRHEAKHTKNIVPGEIGRDRTVDRANKACSPCVLSKVKCDNGRPCKRCEKKSIDCVTTPNVSAASPAPTFLAVNSPLHLLQNRPQHPVSHSRASEVSPETQEPNHSRSPVRPNLEAQVLLDLRHSGGTLDKSRNTASLLDRATVSDPDRMGIEVSHAPKLNFWMPELEWSDQGDLFTAEFTPAIVGVFGDDLLPGQATTLGANSPDPTETDDESDGDDTTRYRHMPTARLLW